MVTKVLSVGIQISRQNLWNCKDDFERKICENCVEWSFIFSQFIPTRNGKRETIGKRSVECEAKMIRKAKSAIHSNLGFWTSHQQSSTNFPQFLKGHEKTRGLLKVKAISNKKHKLVQKTRKWLSKHNFLEKYLHFETEKKCFLILFFCLFTARQKSKKKIKNHLSPFLDKNCYLMMKKFKKSTFFMFSYWESNGVVIGNSVNNSIIFGEKFSIQKLQDFFNYKRTIHEAFIEIIWFVVILNNTGKIWKFWREIQTDPELEQESKTINFPLDTFFLKIHLTISDYNYKFLVIFRGAHRSV